jgi:hypothetical protein
MLTDREFNQILAGNAPLRVGCQATVEAIMYSFRTRGLSALNEPATRERLSRCDLAARKQINSRIAKLNAGNADASPEREARAC